MGCGGAEDEAAVGGHAGGAGVVVRGERRFFDGVLGEGVAGCEEDLDGVVRILFVLFIPNSLSACGISGRGGTLLLFSISCY